MYKLNNAKGLFIIWSVKLVIFWRDSSMHQIKKYLATIHQILTQEDKILYRFTQLIVKYM